MLSGHELLNRLYPLKIKTVAAQLTKEEARDQELEEHNHIKGLEVPDIYFTYLTTQQVLFEHPQLISLRLEENCVMCSAFILGKIEKVKISSP